VSQESTIENYSRFNNPLNQGHAVAVILSKEVLSEEQIVSIDDLYTSLHEVPVEEFVDMACSINY
jgi:hypothetical protein